MQRSISAAIVVTAILVAGCSKKGPECEQLVNTINASVNASNAGAKGDDVTKGLDAEIKSDDDSSAKLGSQTYTVPELKKFAGDYAQMLKDESQNDKDLKAMLAQVDASVAAANAMAVGIKKMGGDCAAAKDPDDVTACAAFMSAVTTLPDDLTNTAALTPALAALGKVTFKDATLQADAKAITDAITTASKIGDTKSVDQIKSKADTLTKQQHDLADSVTKFCSQ